MEILLLHITSMYLILVRKRITRAITQRQRARPNASAPTEESFAPPGLYVFDGHLEIPSGVTLKGSYHSVPSHDTTRATSDRRYDLIPREGRGDAIKDPFHTSERMQLLLVWSFTMISKRPCKFLCRILGRF